MKIEGKLRTPGGNWKNRVIATTPVYTAQHHPALSCHRISWVHILDYIL